MKELQLNPHGVDVTGESETLATLKTELFQLNQETVAEITASLEVLPQTGDEVIKQAEAMGLIWRPLFEKIKGEVEAAREISRKMDLPKPDGGMETQITNMRTVFNIAFLEKERQGHPDRSLLEILYSETRHPQEFINLMVSGEGLYYDSQGQPVNLEGYLRDYYQSLLAQGFELRIESTSARDLSEKELDFVYRQESQTEAAGILEILKRKNIAVPVLVMEHNGRTKRIPILFSDQYLEKIGAYAEYSYIEKGTETYHDVIYINGINPLRASGEDNRTIIEVASSLVHEIDHAVFNFLHDSEYRQYQRELERLEKEEKVLIEGPSLTESEKDQLFKKDKPYWRKDPI